MRKGLKVVIKVAPKTGGVTAVAPQTKTQIAIKTEITVESILKSIRNYLPEPVRDQTERLAKLRDVNGNPILNVKNRENIFQVIGMLQTMTLDELENYFAKETFSEDVIWNSSFFNNEQQKEFADANIYLNRVKVKHGGECKYCKSTNTIGADKQTRGADEAPTISYACQNCGKTWKD